jgi:hypothetical protein
MLAKHGDALLYFDSCVLGAWFSVGCFTIFTARKKTRRAGLGGDSVVKPGVASRGKQISSRFQKRK